MRLLKRRCVGEAKKEQELKPEFQYLQVPIFIEFLAGQAYVVVGEQEEPQLQPLFLRLLQHLKGLLTKEDFLQADKLQLLVDFTHRNIVSSRQSQQLHLRCHHRQD
jgi:hypothetical protein